MAKASKRATKASNVLNLGPLRKLTKTMKHVSVDCRGVSFHETLCFRRENKVEDLPPDPPAPTAAVPVEEAPTAKPQQSLGLHAE